MGVAQQTLQDTKTTNRDTTHVNVKLGASNNISPTAERVRQFELNMKRSTTAAIWEDIKQDIRISNHLFEKEKLEEGPEALKYIEYNTTAPAENPFRDIVKIANYFTKIEAQNLPDNEGQLLPSIRNITKYVELNHENARIGGALTESHGVPVNHFKSEWQMEVGSTLRQEFRTNLKLQEEAKRQQEQKAEKDRLEALREQKADSDSQRRVVFLVAWASQYFGGDIEKQAEIKDKVERYFVLIENNPEMQKRDHDKIMQGIQEQIQSGKPDKKSWAYDARKIVLEHTNGYPLYKKAIEQEAKAAKQAELEQIQDRQNNDTLAKIIIRNRDALVALHKVGKEEAVNAFDDNDTAILPEERELIEKTRATIDTLSQKYRAENENPTKDGLRAFLRQENYRLPQIMDILDLEESSDARKALIADVQERSTLHRQKLNSVVASINKFVQTHNIPKDVQDKLYNSLDGLYEAAANTDQETITRLSGYKDKSGLREAVTEAKDHITSFKDTIEALSLQTTDKSFKKFLGTLESYAVDVTKKHIQHSVKTAKIETPYDAAPLLKEAVIVKEETKTVAPAEQVKVAEAPAMTTISEQPAQAEKGNALANAFHSFKTKVVNLFRSRDDFNTVARTEEQKKELTFIPKVA